MTDPELVALDNAPAGADPLDHAIEHGHYVLAKYADGSLGETVHERALASLLLAAERARGAEAELETAEARIAFLEAENERLSHTIRRLTTRRCDDH